MSENLNKVIEGVESALYLEQSDFGLAATHYFEKLESGECDEVDLFIAFKKFEKFVATILPFIKDKIDETKLGVEYKKHGVSIKTQNGRAFYDFTKCNDETWKLLTNELKSREDLLKTIVKPDTEIVNESTGEIEVFQPPIKKQSQSIVLRYLKDENES